MRIFLIWIGILCLITLGLGERWKVKLSLETVSGDYRDWNNYAGVRSGMSSGYGDEDVEELPIPDPYHIDLYFPHYDSTRPDYWLPPHNRIYAIDIRAPVDRDTFWLDISSTLPYSTNGRIFWNFYDSVSTKYGLWIGPEGAEAPVSLWSLSECGVALNYGAQHWYLAVERDAYDRLIVLPDYISLEPGDTACLTAFLVGASDTAEVYPEWSYTGDGATLDSTGILIATEAGGGYVTASFNEFADTVPAIVAAGGDTAVLMAVKRGWNQISLPVIPDSFSVETIHNISRYVYRYDSESRVYSEPDTLRIGEGYFILCLRDTVKLFVGASFGSYTYQVFSGWNMIGSLSSNTDIAHIEPSHGVSIIPPLYCYNPDSRSYNDFVVVKPGYGYWILATGDGSITLSR